MGGGWLFLSLLLDERVDVVVVYPMIPYLVDVLFFLCTPLFFPMLDEMMSGKCLMALTRWWNWRELGHQGSKQAGRQTGIQACIAWEHRGTEGSCWFSIGIVCIVLSFIGMAFGRAFGARSGIDVCLCCTFSFLWRF